MEKLLNHKISQDYPIIFKFMQVHEDEKVQALSITINDKRVLSLIHARYTKKIQWQENAKLFNCYYQIQDIKYVQHENVNMTLGLFEVS